ncbi:MAG: tRNA glutamyl-Q(34) synthetase GluQRS, partial [Burkholderiaceae bacterium]
MNSPHRFDRSTTYIGRFAPSPTGPLHLGSLCTALASWLDARAHGGSWQLRIEDIDRDRCRPEHASAIIESLRLHGLKHDGPISWQSKHQARYVDALHALREKQLVYRCHCSRKQIEHMLAQTSLSLPPQAERPYPGTCRALMRLDGPGAWRIKLEPIEIGFTDRLAGRQPLMASSTMGDFVLMRADGQWAYQLAVVVDDEVQGITHVVRGDDLLMSTPRQIALQGLLGYRKLRYLHIPVLKNS